MLSVMEWATAWGYGKLLLMFLLVVTPFYLLLRALVTLARLRYGFLPEPADDGRPLRVCFACGNSILETGFSHCPYCGRELPPLTSETGAAAGAGLSGAAGDRSV